MREGCAPQLRVAIDRGPLAAALSIHHQTSRTCSRSAILGFYVNLLECYSFLWQWTGDGRGKVCRSGSRILLRSRCRGEGPRWAPWGSAGSICRAGSRRRPRNTAILLMRTSRSPGPAMLKGMSYFEDLLTFVFVILLPFPINEAFCT